MMTKEKELREEALRRIIETLEDGYNGYYCDLHNEVFNSDYYVIGTYQAEKELEEYGVFDAIEKVQTYEKDNFGEVFTNLSDPEKLINMLFYIIGEEVLFEVVENVKVFDENWNELATEEINNIILQEIKKNN